MSFGWTRYIAAEYPHTSIVAEELGESGSRVTTVAEYVDRMHDTYEHGSHQAGPMRNISLVGTVQVWTRRMFFAEACGSIMGTAHACVV